MKYFAMPYAVGGILVATTCFGAESPSDRPHDWPRFLGPDINGISSETNWRKQWESPPPVLWEARIGIGFSSLSISNGRLYTMGHEISESDEEGARGTDRVFCFDANSGKKLWEHAYTCKQNRHLHEGGPGATPTVTDKVVYTLSREGHLFACEPMTGTKFGRDSCPGDTDVEMPEWGFVSSPLIHGEKVVVDGGCLIAYDRRSGKVLWKTDKYRPGYGSAIPFRFANRDGIAILNNDGLLLVDATDGAEIAWQKWNTSFATNSSTPIVVDDQFFISTGYNRGCALFRLVGDELERIYETKSMRNHFSNCVLWRGHLYGIDGNTHNRRNATLTCIDFTDGDKQWSERGLGVGSLMLAGDTLIVLSDTGELLTVKPTPDEFTELSRAKILDGLCWTPPVLCNGRLYARDASGHLVCIDLRAEKDRSE